MKGFKSSLGIQHCEMSFCFCIVKLVDAIIQCGHGIKHFQGDYFTGADPGFLVGGGANIQICQIFPKKLHEIKKILVHGGHMPWAPPLDPPMFYTIPMPYQCEFQASWFPITIKIDSNTINYSLQ